MTPASVLTANTEQCNRRKYCFSRHLYMHGKEGQGWAQLKWSASTWMQFNGAVGAELSHVFKTLSLRLRNRSQNVFKWTKTDLIVYLWLTGYGYFSCVRNSVCIFRFVSSCFTWRLLSCCVYYSLVNPLPWVFVYSRTRSWVLALRGYYYLSSNFHWRVYLNLHCHQLPAFRCCFLKSSHWEDYWSVLHYFFN